MLRLHVCWGTICVPGVYLGQKRGSDFMERELQMGASIRVGAEPEYSGSASSALNHQAISLAPGKPFQ